MPYRSLLKTFVINDNYGMTMDTIAIMDMDCVFANNLYQYQLFVEKKQVIKFILLKKIYVITKSFSHHVLFLFYIALI